MKTLSVIFSLCLALSVNAQQTFIIENVRFFNGESVLENASVIIENGHISEVKNEKIDGDFRRIDGKNKTLIPALINAHVHAWMPDHLKEAASAGVLSVLDMAGFEMYQDVLRNYKDSTGYAKFYAAGYAATVPEGHGTQFGFPVPTITKPQEAKQFVKDRVNANADYIKIILEPWMATLSIQTVSELIKEAHLNSKLAVIHISRLEDAKLVISNNADGLVHIWRDTPMDTQTLQTLSQEKSFFVIPTLLTTIRAHDHSTLEPENFMTKAQVLAEVKKLYDAGIPILAGTDPPNLDINYGTDLYEELKLFSEAGIPHIDVIKSATSTIATVFGLDDTGKLLEGHPAHMILLDGNPFDDINAISRIVTVWKYGYQVNNE
ncbi:MAG: amidohydrolase family protein [Psychroserpens sp.]|uniref:amidohydrolase family protein n=1 Tax=Psychroserpens sp. TaxID=2020870 RepID=UPI003C87AB2E